MELWSREPVLPETYYPLAKGVVRRGTSDGVCPVLASHRRRGNPSISFTSYALERAQARLLSHGLLIPPGPKAPKRS